MSAIRPFPTVLSRTELWGRTGCLISQLKWEQQALVLVPTISFVSALFFSFLLFYLNCFETESHVAQIVFKFSMQQRMIFNVFHSCFHLPSTVTTGVSHFTSFMWYFVNVRQILPMELQLLLHLVRKQSSQSTSSLHPLHRVSLCSSGGLVIWCLQTRLASN